MLNDLVIKGSNLEVSYKDKVVWKNVSFNLSRGQFTAILGPNGAGKSTLFKLILGLKEPTKGIITVYDEEPKKASKYIGYVPQRKDISNQSNLAAIELVKIAYKGNKLGIYLNAYNLNKKAQEVLKQVDALDLANKRIGQLSGGELQRIFLAQALIDDPKILLLDEPLANLDLRRQYELVELIKKLSVTKKINILLIAHDLNPLSPYIDNLIYVANKRIACGNINEVLTSETLSKLYNSKVEVLKDSTGRLVIVGVGGEDHHHV